MPLFEQAARLKLRFESTRGLISTEDLWDLPLSSARAVSLDQIAMDLHQQLRQTSEVVSFVDEKAATDNTNQLRFDIVKYIIDVKKEERAKAAAARARAETKELLLAALQRKREGAINDMSEEDLQKKLAEL